MGRFSPILDERLVYHLDLDNQQAVLTEMVEAIAKEGVIPDAPSFLRKVLERENLVSTSIGRQIALPHAKMQEISSFFFAVALLKRGVDWHTIDNLPVRLIFLIGGPTGKETEYLALLSQITRFLKDEDKLKKILTSKSKEAIIGLLG